MPDDHESLVTRATHGDDVATDAAFADADWDALDREFRDYLKRLRAKLR